MASANSNTNVDLLVEEPPQVRRMKKGRWDEVVERIAAEHTDEWVRVVQGFASSKEARAAITSMQASAARAGKNLTGAVRRVDNESRIWVRLTEERL